MGCRSAKASSPASDTMGTNAMPRPTLLTSRRREPDVELRKDLTLRAAEKGGVASEAAAAQAPVRGGGGGDEPEELAAATSPVEGSEAPHTARPMLEVSRGEAISRSHSSYLLFQCCLTPNNPPGRWALGPSECPSSPCDNEVLSVPA
mmetsp:Transcript_48263/g.140717  ORF Transcript_48263/g.140717 Transcript_48263/m.140717 type:complete len:148 (-) Transcript_48263:302-745(-)